MKRFTLVCAAFAAIVMASTTSCGTRPDGPTDGTDSLNKKKDTTGLVVDMGGKIFIIPSPVQTAVLIKNSGATYDKGILNSAGSVNSYSTNYLKAINLGIYGADLGYVTLYDQTQDALGYFQTVKKLADDLGVSAAFDKTLLERFQKNLGKKDSMISLVTDAYKASDTYLKKNDRKDIGALVIAGGFIESLHFATSINKQKGSTEVVNRIAQQKISLENLIGLMKENAGQEEYAELIKGLEELKSEFDGIQFKYVYEKPVTDEKNKVTSITSRTEVTISQAQIDAITSKVEALRKLLVG